MFQLSVCVYISEQLRINVLNRAKRGLKRGRPFFTWWRSQFTIYVLFAIGPAKYLLCSKDTVRRTMTEFCPCYSCLFCKTKQTNKQKTKQKSGRLDIDGLIKFVGG